MGPICVFLIAFLLSDALALIPKPGVKYSAVHNDHNEWKVIEGSVGVASGVWQDSLHTTGWHRLDLWTDGKEADTTQAYAAGFLEGALTRETMWLNFQNFYKTIPIHSIPEKVVTFAKDQDVWLHKMTAQHAANDPYWFQVGLILQQLRGLFDAYNVYSTKEQKVDHTTMLLYQLNYELGDIQQGVVSDPAEQEPLLFQKRMEDSHCSVLVRLSEDKQHLFSSHVTWAHFRTMLRIYKFYTFNFKHSATASKLISFPSYPGQLYSGDDWYLTTQKLVITETTNGVMNGTLYKEGIKLDTVPFWIRVMAANRMATGGKEWNDVFGRLNSGTYNNQWQVVDYKLFEAGKPIRNNLLWISEQIPGYYIASDKSDYIRNQNHWPSYNIPYYPFVYNISGYPAYFKKYGNMYSYSKCARAQIFARDQGKVNTFEEYKQIMRYNNYQEDPLALHDACRGISARCDLNVPWQENTMNGFDAFGATDAKVTNEELIESLITAAISGPTWDDQPPFSWTSRWENRYSHLGHPKTFAFDWVQMKPQ